MTRTALLALSISFAAFGCGVDEPGSPPATTADDQLEASERAVLEDGVQVAEMTIDGADFKPSAVAFKPGVPARLVITRTDAPTCVDSIAAPGLGIRAMSVPVNVPVTLEFTPEIGGAFTLACGMDMVTARLVVRS